VDRGAYTGRQMKITVLASVQQWYCHNRMGRLDKRDFEFALSKQHFII